MKTNRAKPSKHKLLPELENYISKLFQENETIGKDRKKVLKQIAAYIQDRVTGKKQTNLMFICTHNSRRSHMGQLWAQVASIYSDIPDVMCFSGGTEETAFNIRSVRALQKAGFEIKQFTNEENPLYNIKHSNELEVVTTFSKKYSHERNPQKNFAAIMTCSDADEACPVVHGSDKRFSVQYDDPKVSDDTAEEENVYDERCRQIAREMVYLF